MKFISMLCLSAAPLALGVDGDDVDVDWLAEVLEIESEVSDEFSFVEGLYPEVDTDFTEIEIFERDQSARFATDWQIATGVGWKENVLLTEDNPLSSAFGQIEFDGIFTRNGIGRGPEITGVVYGEYRYFEDVPGLDAESLGVGSVAADWGISEHWRFGVLSEVVYSEQAFDASLVEFETEAATISVFQPEMGLKLSAFSKGSEHVGSLVAKSGKVFFDEEGQDYLLNTLQLESARNVEAFGRFSGSVVLYQEKYDDKRERNLAEGLLEDMLVIDGVQARLDWRLSRDEGLVRDLKTSFRFDFEDDAVGDYYERNAVHLSQSAGLEWGKWESRVTLGYFERDYTQRPIDFGSDENREDDGWSWGIQVQRPVLDHFDVIFRVRGTNKQSNAEGLSYDTKSIYLGISWRRG